jgi:hypothetical protein
MGNLNGRLARLEQAAALVGDPLKAARDFLGWAEGNASGGEMQAFWRLADKGYAAHLAGERFEPEPGDDATVRALLERWNGVTYAQP